MMKNKRVANAWLMAGLLSAPGLLFAQAGTPTPAPPAGAMAAGAASATGSMQDCRDHANTAQGEKRNDTPANADTDKACANVQKKSPAGKKPAKGGAASAAM